MDAQRTTDRFTSSLSLTCLWRNRQRCKPQTSLSSKSASIGVRSLLSLSGLTRTDKRPTRDFSSKRASRWMSLLETPRARSLGLSCLPRSPARRLFLVYLSRRTRVSKCQPLSHLEGWTRASLRSSSLACLRSEKARAATKTPTVPNRQRAPHQKILTKSTGNRKAADDTRMRSHSVKDKAIRSAWKRRRKMLKRIMLRLSSLRTRSDCSAQDTYSL